MAKYTAISYVVDPNIQRIRTHLVFPNETLVQGDDGEVYILSYGIGKRHEGFKEDVEAAYFSLGIYVKDTVIYWRV